MATQSFFVLNSDDELSGGVIKGKNKTRLGIARQELEPSGNPYVVCKLEGHWIITDEEKRLLTKLKKNGKNIC